MALVLGCAGRNINSSATPTSSPTSTPTATPAPSTQAGPMIPAPSVTANNSTNGASGVDDSFLNISSEPDESLPEDGIPTPEPFQ